MLLNGPVKPRLPTFFVEALDDLHILFCYEGHIKPGDAFQPNHFVPLLSYTNQHKKNFLVYSQDNLLRRLRVAD